MIFTEMQPKHVPAVAGLEQLCFSQPWSEAALLESLQSPQAVFLVALEGETLLGYGGMHLVLGEGYIDNIAVFPQYRGRGVASGIINALAERAEVFLTLEVRESNLPARRLYASLHFQEAGRRRNFYSNPTEDGLIYTKHTGKEWDFYDHTGH